MMNELRLEYGQFFHAALDRHGLVQGEGIEWVERLFDHILCQLTKFPSIGRRRLNKDRPLVQIFAARIIGCFCVNENVHCFIPFDSFEP